MNKGDESFMEPIPGHSRPLEGIEPCKKAFNFPTSAVSSQGSGHPELLYTFGERAVDEAF